MNKPVKRVIRIFILFMAVLLLSSCMTTYKMPSAQAPSNTSILGKYYFEEDDGSMELSLFADGYFLIRAYFSDDDEWGNLIGTYTVDSNGQTMKFYYDDELAQDMNHTAFIKNSDTPRKPVSFDPVLRETL